MLSIAPVSCVAAIIDKTLTVFADQYMGCIFPKSHPCFLWAFVLSLLQKLCRWLGNRPYAFLVCFGYVIFQKNLKCSRYHIFTSWNYMFCVECKLTLYCKNMELPKQTEFLLNEITSFQSLLSSRWMMIGNSDCQSWTCYLAGMLKLLMHCAYYQCLFSARSLNKVC